MDFGDVDPLGQFRDEARRWMDQHFDPAWPHEQRTTGRFHTPALHALLAAEGIYGAGWPKEFGGSDVDPGLADAIMQAVVAAGCRHDGWATTWNVLNTILVVGTYEQKAAYVAGGLRGEVIISLGYTEADAGSDVAAARFSAVRQGEGWLLNGEKMFTSTADQASHVFVLARTSRGTSKQQGLTLFLVPTDSEGFEWQPIHTLGGHYTTSTTYRDVELGDHARVGAIDGGWDVMRTSLVFERKGAPGKVARSGRSLVDRLLQWATDNDQRDLFASSASREHLARIAVNSEVSRLLWARFYETAAASAQLGRQSTGTEGAAAKVFGTETERRTVETLLELLGPQGLLHRDAEGAPLDGLIDEGFRYGVVESIYGGSSEVMREIIAERELGLPRASRSAPIRAAREEQTS
jgi:alkylation response protein AidB-like acyl-CoA dehydrogenase